MDNNNPKKEFQLGLFGRPCKLQPQNMFLFFIFCYMTFKNYLLTSKIILRKKKILKIQ
jgi:hypothetical protein